MNDPKASEAPGRPTALSEPRPMAARTLLAALPASVTLPAGTGKTHLLVDLVTEVHADADARGPRAGQQRKVLVLTHTNAGVQVVRDRLQGEPAASAHVSTITTFAFEFARSYPRLGGIELPEQPDWTRSPDYLRAATRVCGNQHVQRVLAASYSHVLVDEYQDCSELHHQLVLELRRAVRATAVLGDPLQAVFGFDAAAPLVAWSTVQETFPDHPVEAIPWRWQAHNRRLGDWLLGLRGQIHPGALLDLSDSQTPAGVVFLRRTPDQQALRSTLSRLSGRKESVLVLSGKSRQQTRATAASIGSLGYTALEDINGTYMRRQLDKLAGLPPSERPSWAAELAKDCFSGFAGIDKPVLNKLANGQASLKLKRPDIEQTLAALDSITESPDMGNLAKAMQRIAGAGEGRLHCAEAWHDTTIAIAIAATVATTECSSGELGEALLGALGAVRDRLRRTGSRERRRQIARTLLVKGLEYDHVVIANLAELSDACNLYVALTRARRSVTIIGPHPRITVTATNGAQPMHIE